MSFLSKLLRTTTLLGKSGEIEIAALPSTTKYYLLYFSASWCPPCRGFTPQLAEYYQRHKEAKAFEVILCSWDEEQEDFDDYYKHHPWLAVRFGDAEKIMEDLNKTFSVESIPTVIVLDADGKVVSSNARAQIPKDPEAANFPYSA